MTNPIKPPVGSYVAMVFRVTGYDPDCGETPETATMDGSNRSTSTATQQAGRPGRSVCMTQLIGS